MIKVIAIVRRAWGFLQSEYRVINRRNAILYRAWVFQPVSFALPRIIWQRNEATLSIQLVPIDGRTAGMNRHDGTLEADHLGSIATQCMQCATFLTHCANTIG